MNSAKVLNMDLRGKRNSWILGCVMIIYDTNNIMKHYGVDDYMIAVIELYLDILNLFRYLLLLLSMSGRT